MQVRKQQLELDQASSWVGPGKPNLPLELRGKAGGSAPNLNLEFRVEKINVFEDGGQAERSLRRPVWVGVARGEALMPS